MFVPYDKGTTLFIISRGTNRENPLTPLMLDKGKIQTLISQQRTILADVDYLNLDSIANVVRNFENPKQNDENQQNAEKYSLRIDRWRIPEASAKLLLMF